MDSITEVYRGWAADGPRSVAFYVAFYDTKTQNTPRNSRVLLRSAELTFNIPWQYRNPSCQTSATTTLFSPVKIDIPTKYNISSLMMVSCWKESWYLQFSIPLCFTTAIKEASSNCQRHGSTQKFDQHSPSTLLFGQQTKCLRVPSPLGRWNLNKNLFVFLFLIDGMGLWRMSFKRLFFWPFPHSWAWFYSCIGDRSMFCWVCCCAAPLLGGVDRHGRLVVVAGGSAWFVCVFLKFQSLLSVVFVDFLLTYLSCSGISTLPKCQV